LFFFIFAFKTEYSILVINILSFISTSHPLYISDPSKQTNRGAHSSFSPFFTHPTPPPLPLPRPTRLLCFSAACSSTRAPRRHAPLPESKR
jgi:hypothetical protein